MDWAVNYFVMSQGESFTVNWSIVTLQASEKRYGVWKIKTWKLHQNLLQCLFRQARINYAISAEQLMNTVLCKLVWG